MEEKKQQNPTSVRVPKDIERDFRAFVASLRAGGRKLFLGRCAGAALIRFMMDDEKTQKYYYGLAASYALGDISTLRIEGAAAAREMAKGQEHRRRPAKTRRQTRAAKG